jgi:hypothetical protein
LALTPDHPVRVLLDAATRNTQLGLLDAVLEDQVAAKKEPRDLAAMRRLVFKRDLAGIEKLLRKQPWPWGGAAPPPPPPPATVLIITDVQPPVDWTSGDPLRISYRVQNVSGQLTSGIIHGTATQASPPGSPCPGGGVLRSLVSSRWFQRGAGITNLAPGQALDGVLDMKLWTANQRIPGLVDIDLQYWVEDPMGTITFVWHAPLGVQHDATYRADSFSHMSYGQAASFAQDIRPYFRQQDIDAMSFFVLLNSYDDVKTQACAIYSALATNSPSFRMPCDGRWPKDRIATFRLWIDEGMQP